MGNVGTEHLHQEAPDYREIIKEQSVANDPTAAIQQVLAEKTIAENKARRLEEQLAEVKQERDAAMKVSEDLKPYEHILEDSRTFLPIYLRRAVTWKRLLVKLRIRYGPLVDIHQASAEGRKAAHRRIDGAVEECLEYCILNWHNVQGRLEVLDAQDSNG